MAAKKSKRAARQVAKQPKGAARHGARQTDGATTRAKAKSSAAGSVAAPAKKWTLPAITRAEGERRFWLLKSEPEMFSYDDLERAVDRTTYWDGVRNNQARIYLRDQMKAGDGVLYYHSGGEEPAIVGVAKVVREGYRDWTAFEVGHEHHDPKAKEANPWIMVDIQAVAPTKRPLPLAALRDVEALRGMVLLQKGSRLSVQPVSAAEWAAILSLGGVTE